MKKCWWKILTIILIIYTLIQGFLGATPSLPILNETIRNLYFHVTIWFSMVILLFFSMIYSIKYLGNFNLKNDLIANECVNTGVFLGLLGILTGMLWANFTWGKPWVNDPKLNGAAITMLVYLAYIVLRSSISDNEKTARISAIYNIFAFSMMLVFIFVLPRLTDSLHPGNGGNPAFSQYDLDNNMRAVFYPAVIGWTLLGFWITQIRIRIKQIKNQLNNE